MGGIWSLNRSGGHGHVTANEGHGGFLFYMSSNSCQRVGRRCSIVKETTITVGTTEVRGLADRVIFFHV